MVGLIDCDNFFCSCERVFRPDLQRTPLVVLSNNDGCVVARSREVKAMGVREGMPYFELKQEYGDRGIVAFSSNYTLYGDLSARIMAILRERVPEVVQYSIDEAFLNLDGMNPHSLKLWGERLCADIERCVGTPVSLGIAPTPTLAKLASRFAKRYAAYRKCCLIATEQQRLKALELTDVADVWGVGRRIAARLGREGIRTALHFARKDPVWVRSNLHVTGLRTWTELNGTHAIDPEGMEHGAKKSIMTSRSFPTMITEPADLRSHVANFAARCAAKLRRQGSDCRMLTLFISSNHFREDLEQYDSSGFYNFHTATSTTMELVGAATAILEKIFRRGIFYKRAGVLVDNLTPANALQPDLFSYDPEMRSRQMAVCGALDTLNGRYGADMVVLGSQHYTDHDPNGRSIKFAQAIRRDLKSPDYSTSLSAFRVR